MFAEGDDVTLINGDSGQVVRVLDAHDRLVVRVDLPNGLTAVRMVDFEDAYQETDE